MSGEYIHLDRSSEHGSYIIEALETAHLPGHFNVENQGLITNLPDGCTIESRPMWIATASVPPLWGRCPKPCAATCR